MAYFIKDKTLPLLDVVAKKLSSLKMILDHLSEKINGIYFSPDRFTKEAIAEPYLS